jgi:hypothetical protein
MRVKFGNATKDVPILEVNAANYIVPQGEEGAYHCRIEQLPFSPSDGRRLSRPRIQKFEPKSWPIVKRNLQQQGWTIDVLYDPTEWLAKENEKAQMTLAERERLAQEAKEKERAAMQEALMAEVMAELKEEGVIKSDESGEKETKGGSKKK